MNYTADRSAPGMMSVADVLHYFNRRSRQWLYDLMRRDPTFPRPREIGSEFSAQFKRSEILEWIDAQPRQEPTGVSVIERRRAHAQRKRDPGALRCERTTREPEVERAGLPESRRNAPTPCGAMRAPGQPSRRPEKFEPLRRLARSGDLQNPADGPPRAYRSLPS
jgi:predicted DNA-binding transcriptional regulator AlpA